MSGVNALIQVYRQAFVLSWIRRYTNQSSSVVVIRSQNQKRKPRQDNFIRRHQNRKESFKLKLY